MDSEEAWKVLHEIEGGVHQAHVDELQQIIADLREDRLVYVEELSIDDLLFALQARLLDENIDAEERLEKALWADAMKAHGETVARVQRIDHMLAEEEEGGADGG